MLASFQIIILEFLTNWFDLPAWARPVGFQMGFTKYWRYRKQHWCRYGMGVHAVEKECERKWLVRWWGAGCAAGHGGHLAMQDDYACSPSHIHGHGEAWSSENVYYGMWKFTNGSYWPQNIIQKMIHLDFQLYSRKSLRNIENQWWKNS